MIILKAIKFHFKGSNDEQNLTLMVISYECFEKAAKMTTRVRFSISKDIIMPWKYQEMSLYHRITLQLIGVVSV